MRFSVEDAIAAGLWVARGILALLSASDYWSTRTFLVTSEEVNHAHEVVEQLDHLLAEMTDAETGQRGYLITGSVRYLAPYEQATTRIADTLHAIRVLTADGSAAGGRAGGAGARPRRGAARGAGGLAAQVRVPRPHEPRDPHPDDRAGRLHGAARRPRPLARGARRGPGHHPAERRAPDDDRQRHPRPLEDRVRADDDRADGLLALRAGGRGGRRAAPAGGARRPRRRGRVSQPTSGDDRDRPHPTPPDPPEPRRQRDQVHPQGA